MKNDGGSERTFSAAELAEFCGLPGNVLRRFVDRELLAPMRGAVDRYSFRAAGTVRVLAQLWRAGWSAPRIERAWRLARTVVADPDAALTGLLASIGQRRITVRAPDGRLFEPGGQLLFDFAAAWHGRDSPQALAWGEDAKGVLRERGGAGLLAWLESSVPGGLGADGAAALADLRGYVGNNQHRMDYPAYRARGWDIGSGPVEAGCKVLGGRVKGAGMRGCAPYAAAVAGLRGLYASADGRWDQFWARPARAAA